MNKSTQKADVCIIGSGSGGGVVAKELAEKGINVVVLEAGRRYDPLRDYTAARTDWEIANWGSEKFKVAALNKVTFGIRGTKRPNEVHGVGGGTLRYDGYAVRMRPDDFHVYSSDGVGMDWPITYKDLVPYYRKVELELGVSGKAGDPWTPNVEPYPNPPFPYSYANKIIKRGCDRLGIRLWPAPMARLSRPFDGRPMCVQCGDCGRGCMSGAKSSIDVTYISKAEATGKMILRPECIATRIEINPQGKAKSVIYFDKNGVEHEQEAEVIVVSAGVVQSPRLLLNSKSNLFPDGLANSNGLVGKYFMQHLGIDADGIFPDRIDSYRGFLGGAISQDFAKSSSTNSFARGWTTDLHSGIRAPVKLALKSSTWGTQLKNYMQNNFGHSAGIYCNAEQLPDERNYLELDPEVRDDYGMPVPRITFRLLENDKLILKAMKKKLIEIIDAAGAKKVYYEDIKPGGTPHNYGGCRMGKDSNRSVLNSFCQSHEVPNLFVVDASCFVTIGTANPSLTIHAIAVRSSEYIAAQGKKRNL
jgi:choline dehydrogenase-like flavoprotein